MSYDAPTATDNLDPSVEVTCTPASGSTFAARQQRRHLLGAGFRRQHRHRVVHRDGAGHDRSAPDGSRERRCRSNLRGRPRRHVRDGGDGCGHAVADVVCLPASGSTFALGTTPVSCSDPGQRRQPGRGVVHRDRARHHRPGAVTTFRHYRGSDSASGRSVSFAATATDAVSGPRIGDVQPRIGQHLPRWRHAGVVRCHGRGRKFGAGRFTVTITRSTSVARRAARRYGSCRGEWQACVVRLRRERNREQRRTRLAGRAGPRRFGTSRSLPGRQRQRRALLELEPSTTPASIRTAASIR